MALPPSIGKYRVDKCLGEGGMGTVYLAHDAGIDRHVAIKVLRASNDETRQRFRSEARLAGRLKHPNIVTVHDYSDLEGNPCIVMEYVEGGTLADLIRRGATLPDARKIELIEQVCRGLAYAHRAGIVHRDIKPSNLMVDLEGTIKIVDFGIARTSERGVTITGRLLGTLAYMAPEQVLGEAVDGRCDIFAVGVVLYELLTGQEAFPGNSDYAICNRIAVGQPEPFTHPDAAFSAVMGPVVDKALAKDPAHRYQDADELAAALAAIRNQLAPVVTPTVADAPADDTSSLMPARYLAETLDAPRPQRRPSEMATMAMAVPIVRKPTGPQTPSLPAASRTRPRIWRTAAVAAMVAAIAFVWRQQPNDEAAPTPAIETRGESTPAAGPAAPPDQPPAPLPTVPPTVTAATPSASIQPTDVVDTLTPGQPKEPKVETVPERSRVQRATKAEGTDPGAIPPATAPGSDRARQAAQLVTEGRQRYANGDYDPAIAAYEAALKLDAKNAEAMSGLAETRKAQAAELAVFGGAKKKQLHEFAQW